MMQIVVTLVLALFSLLAGYGYGVKDGAQHVQAKWDAEKAALVTSQRTKEAELQANMDKLRTEKNRETAKLQRTVAALTDSLRDRPERPAVPASTSAGDAGRGCTGAELYREDAELVVAESERAEIIRITLKKCQDAYRKASGQ
jgi:sRNA-binding protein